VTTTPYMQSMFDAQEIVEFLPKDDGGRVRVIAYVLRELTSRRTKCIADLAGFARCKKCGEVNIAHPLQGCANFKPKH